MGTVTALPKEFPETFEGQTVLICGSAPCIYNDFALAIEHRSDAKVIAINEAAGAVFADFICSLHVAEMTRFLEMSLNPEAITITGKDRIHHYEQWFDDAEYWFKGCNTSATSSYSAAQIARLMGFSEIILCGAPMNGGDGYYNKPKNVAKPFFEIGAGTRFGMERRNKDSVRTHQNKLKQYAEAEDVSMMSSMGGFSAEVLGTPSFIQ